MFDPNQIGNWLAGLLDELTRIPEYAAQLGAISSFFADLGRSIWDHVVSRNDEVRNALQR